MNRLTKTTLVRNLLAAALALASATGTATADWTYEYTDTFTSDKAQFDSYLHSAFQAEGVNPLPQPYLSFTDSGANRGILFMEYQGQPAELGYAFPIGGTGIQRMVKGVLQVDVSFPSTSTVSQVPPGLLSYSTSVDGAAWTEDVPLYAGRREIAISSPGGTAYVRFTGARAKIDNLYVSLYSPTATLSVWSNAGTIQQAIDSAGNGDIIEVNPGTYTGPGNWDLDFRGKAITVRSANGPESTIIECGRPASGTGRRGVYFHRAERADSVLSGFTIRGGRMLGSTVPSSAVGWSANPSHPIGGGIYCEFSSPTIVNCIIEDCGAELGGGIGVAGGGPTITDCLVRQCIAGGLSQTASGGRGAGIAVVGQANATITCCTLRDNNGHSGSLGAGLYIQSSTVVVDGCTITGNTAPGNLQGGGAYCAGDATYVTLENCVFSLNQADGGAGIFTTRTSTLPPAVSSPFQRCRVEIINCTIAGNRLANPWAAGETGGVYSNGTDVTIRNSIVWFNGGKPLDLISAGVTTPVTYSSIQGDWPGIGNIDNDPLFASTSAPDYHLRSTIGRYDPYSGWVTDSSTSPCIDAGDPKSSAAEEPPPNGGRVNMGAYGATREASKGFESQIYHVDAQTGRDYNNGRSRERAFKSLHKAFDTVQNGDTILVWPGVYNEELDFNRKAITVQSAADAAVITAPNGYAFSFYGAESSQSVLRNFIITGCGEGAIYCDGASPMLKNLTIVGNSFGINALAGADPRIVNGIIWGNTYGSLYGCKARYTCLQETNPDKAAGNINLDPLFADPRNGDYHLRSRYGRYEPRTDSWLNDTETSPCIDRGDPEEEARDERSPNGGRVNMGAYGNTPYASMSSHM